LNMPGRKLVGLAALALALIVVLSFAASPTGRAPSYAVFPPVHGKHVAKGAYIDPYLYYTSPPAPTGIDDFGLYNYTSAPLRGEDLTILTMRP